MQEMPIHGTSFLDGEAQTYPGGYPWLFEHVVLHVYMYKLVDYMLDTENSDFCHDCHKGKVHKKMRQKN